MASATFGNPLQDSSDEVHSLAVGGNGLIYVAGSTGAGTSNLTGQAALASFSATGAVVNLRTLPLGTAAGGQDTLSALVPLPNGQLLVGGTSSAASNGSTNPTTTTLVIERINSDLSLDTSFAVGGLYHGPSGALLPATEMAVTSDGAIVSACGPFVVRLTANGQPDPTFGVNGVATPLGQTGPTPPPHGSIPIFDWLPVAIDPITGNILVGGLEFSVSATQLTFETVVVTGRFKTSHLWALQNQPRLWVVSDTSVDSRAPHSCIAYAARSWNHPAMFSGVTSCKAEPNAA